MNNPQSQNLFDLDLIASQDFSDSYETIVDVEQESQMDGKKYIVFMLDETLFAVASDRVSEVVRTMPFTTLPNVPEWLAGIANLRGDIITIIELQTFWELRSNDSPKSKLIVLRTADVNSQIALKVDKLREIVNLPDSEIETVKQNEHPYLSGKAIYKSNQINLIDVEQILDSLKLN